LAARLDFPTKYENSATGAVFFVVDLVKWTLGTIRKLCAQKRTSWRLTDWCFAAGQQGCGGYAPDTESEFSAIVDAASVYTGEAASKTA
jgi:hypothetical protein